MKAKVEDQVDVHSYNVHTKDGTVFCRDRRHLRKSQQPPAAVPPPMEESSSDQDPCSFQGL